MMNRGFSILEVIVVSGIVTLTFTAVMYVVLSTPLLLTRTTDRLTALQTLEQTYIELQQELVTHSIGSSQTTSDIHGFTHTTMLGTTTQFGAQKHYEHIFQNETPMLSVTGFRTDIAHAHKYACSPFLFTAWTTPTYHATTVPLPPLSTLTATRSYIIAAASSTQGVSDGSLFLFTRPELPGSLDLLSSYDLGSTTKTGYVSIAATATHVYALSAHTCLIGVSCASLDIFSLAHNRLTLVRSIPLPQARTVTVYRDLLLIGIRVSPNDPEVQVFTISDPDHPTRMGGVELDTSVTDIATDGTYAYVGTTDNSVAGAKALVVFELHTSSQDLSLVSTFRPAGAGISQKVASVEHMIVLGRSSPSFSKEIYVYDRDTRKELASYDTDSSVSGVVARTPGVFILTRTKLLFWNEHTELKELLTFPNTTNTTGLTCGGRNLYVAQNTSSGGHILTVSGS